MYASFESFFSPVLPPNMTAFLSSTAVSVNDTHGGGLSPVVTGVLHAPLLFWVKNRDGHQ